MKTDRRLFLTSSALAGTSFLLSGSLPQAKAASRPNIVYINLDDLGWKDVGFMGSEYYHTPNMDRLASQGMVFSNAYAAAANCTPSRACCLSGQYGPRHGVYTVGGSVRGDNRTRKLIPIPNNTVLASDNVTIAEVLQAAGYQTASVGKWHIGLSPKEQGFGTTVAGAGGTKSYFSPYNMKGLPDGPAGEHLPARLTDEAIAWVKEHREGPFFLYVPYYSVHSPHQAPQELIEKYQREGGKKGQSNATFAAMVESVDTHIGRLMQALDDLGLTDNTLVLLTSDNGGIARVSSQAPLRGGKGTYYEGGVREPLIVRWPGKVKPGSTNDTPIHGIDFFPTFLEAANIPVPEGKVLDGVSILPVLTGTGQLEERPLFWHFPVYLQMYAAHEGDRDPLFRTRPGSTLRLGQWKLHEYFEDGALELYDLEKDLGEAHNLAEEMPEKARELHQVMLDWRARVKAPVPTELNPEYDPAYDLELQAKVVAMKPGERAEF